jgi:hypothetical protein
MLTTLRTELINDLTAGFAVTGTGFYVPAVHVYEAWPDTVRAPCVLVGPDQPYVSAGQTFGMYEVHLSVSVFTSKRLADLDQLIETVLLNSADWGMVGVSAPGIVTVAAVDLLGVTIQLVKQGKI